MKEKNLALLRDILVVFMNHCLFTVCAVTLLGVLECTQLHFFYFSALALVPLCFLFIRHCVKNLALFSLLHFFAGFVFVIAAGDIFAKAVASIITVLYIVMSFIAVFKLKQRTDYLLPPVLVIGIIFACSLINTLRIKAETDLFFVSPAVLFLVLYIFYLYLNRYLSFLAKTQEDGSYLPKGKILSCSFKETSVFAFISTVLLLLCTTFSSLGKFTTLLGNRILNLARAFFNLFEHRHYEAVEQTQINNSAPSLGLGAPSKGGNNFFTQALAVFFLIIVLIFILTILISLIKAMRRLLKKLNMLPNRKADSLLDTDIREKCGVSSLKTQKKKRLPFLDRRTKIRNTYRRRMLKAKYTLVGNAEKENLSLLTAKECCDKLSEPELLKLYEKARYSGENITAEDLRIL